MKSNALKKAGKLMAEARMILEADEGGDGNKGQDGTKPADDIMAKKGDIEGDAAGTGDTGNGPSDPVDVGSQIAQKVAAGMDQATDLVKKIVGESVRRAFESAYGKDRKGMVAEYNRMNLKEMGKFATGLEKVAEGIASRIDFKEVVYNALGEMLKR